jgi:hypothetical protein
MIAEIDCEITGPNPAGSGENTSGFFRPIQCGFRLRTHIRGFNYVTYRAIQ